ncbi:glutaredoxin family protein [Salipaludibacillus sp. HK11]|uniref:glutaredoxin family protein n=1 Tax=Salipaludibacillus sp. HK11 TaxID=3394320 RepID=UPI0039FBBAAB
MTNNVVVFTSEGCSYCEKVLDFFKGHGIEPHQRNVSHNEVDFKEWKSINPIGTPLTCYGEKQVVGFNEKKLLAIAEQYNSK